MEVLPFPLMYSHFRENNTVRRWYDSRPNFPIHRSFSNSFV